MFGVGFFEMVIIAVVALVVVGPKRLPEVMRQAGRLFVHVRRTANDVRATFDQVIREAENEIRMEEAASLRQALQPVLDAKKEVAAALSAQEHEVAAAVKPAGTATYTPGGSLQAAAAASAEAPPAAAADAAGGTMPAQPTTAPSTAAITAQTAVAQPAVASPTAPAGSPTSTMAAPSAKVQPPIASASASPQPASPANPPADASPPDANHTSAKT